MRGDIPFCGGRPAPPLVGGPRPATTGSPGPQVPATRPTGGGPAGVGRRCRSRAGQPHRVGQGALRSAPRLRVRHPGGRTPPLPWSGSRRRCQLVCPLRGREGSPRPGGLRRSPGWLCRCHGHRPGVCGRPALAMAAPIRRRIPGPQPAAVPAPVGLAGNLRGPVRRRRSPAGGVRMEWRRPGTAEPGGDGLAFHGDRVSR